MLSRDEVELARALERCEIPGGGFPHAAHLRVAWVYLHECQSIDQAIDRMAETLRRFAGAVGQAEKYSDPITAFWMLQVAAARAAMPGASFEAVLQAYPRLLDKNLIRAHEVIHVITSGPTDSSGDAPDRPVPGRSA
jgi:hypothetical protein